MTEPAKIVPFGKYKGQPIEVLQGDPGYVEWLMAQDWFKQRFQPTYNLIVNNFGAPSETPDHNALQALFLDGQWAVAFVKMARKDFDSERKIIREIAGEQFAAAERQRRNIESNVEYHRETAASIREQIAEIASGARRQDGHWNHPAKLEVQALHHDAEALKAEAKATPQVAEFRALGDTYRPFLGSDWPYRWWVPNTPPAFEVDGVDVVLRYGFAPVNHGSLSTGGRLDVEIKPNVGDDYPAILRQMKANSSKVLFTREYAGVGATREQFEKIFASAGIIVVYAADVDAEMRRESA